MVVDNVQQLEVLKEKAIFLYPILKDDRLHRHHNSIIAFVFVDIEARECYTLSNGHPEGLYNSSDLSFLDSCKVYCYDSLSFKYAGYDTSKFVDVKMQYYLYTNQSYSNETPGIVNHYTRTFQSCHKINELISLYKHEQIAFNIFEESWVKESQSGLSFYQNDLLDVFYNIEKSGLKVDPSLFAERFGKTFSRSKDYCYTEYNYYTTTGRPSNRFGGINFAALNKEDNTRDAFISRFENGILVEMDFNSYHPRLIASLVGYDFGDDNVYEHLATYYANTPTPSKEEIEKAKEATFRQLYGGIQQQYLHIPFFEKTNNLAHYLWNKIQDEGHIESPISGRRLVISNYQDINCYVLFNYFIQMYETETNVIVLKNILEKSKDMQCVPVLYTYDSILFDLPKTEFAKLTTEIIPQSIDMQKYPIKVKKGTTYKNLTLC